MRHGTRLTACLLLSFLALSPALAQKPQEKKTRGLDNPNVASGVRYLQSVAPKEPPGEAALAALAMHKADLPDNDPAIQACLRTVFSRFTESAYVPVQSGGYDNYEFAVVCMALTAIDPGTFKPQIEIMVRQITRAQKSHGAWDYPIDRGGDVSMTQYCILALWEAESIGIDVAPSVWDNCATYFLNNQSSGGGWSYHPAEGGRYEPTISMTCAGVGSLLICEDMLVKFRKTTAEFNPLLTPLIFEGTVLEKYARYKVKTKQAALQRSVARGLDWIRANYKPENEKRMGESVFYGLYATERTAALAGDKFGKESAWYAPGAAFARAHQEPAGSWNSHYGETPNTSWAILFLVKSTAKTLRKIELRRLGAGTLIGGRNLPADLNNVTIAQGRVVVKPMNGAIEGMLAVLEDPRAMNADSALAGLVSRYQSQGPNALRPFKDRFRKLLEDRDPGIRRVACWGLGRSADLDVVPNLVSALLDPSPQVVVEARVGLQLLSRKLDSLGPPRGASAKQKLAAARKWRDWYQAARTPDMPAIDDPRLNLPPAQPPPESSKAQAKPEPAPESAPGASEASQ